MFAIGASVGILGVGISNEIDSIGNPYLLDQITTYPELGLTLLKIFSNAITIVGGGFGGIALVGAIGKETSMGIKKLSSIT